MSKLITVLWIHYVHLTDFKSFRLETLPGLRPGFESLEAHQKSTIN